MQSRHRLTICLLGLTLASVVRAEPVRPLEERPPQQTTVPAPTSTDYSDLDLRNPSTPAVPDAPTPFSPGVQNQPAPFGTVAPEPSGSSPIVPPSIRGVDLKSVRPGVFGRGGTQGLIQLGVANEINTLVRYEIYGLGQRFKYELSREQRQKFPEDRIWGIRFHRGLTDEFVSYRLLEGTYEFCWTDAGWELQLVQAGPGMPPPPPQRPTAAGSPARTDSGELPPPPKPE